MANIAVNNYCNLRCPYCFANRYITEEEKNSITIEQLDRILEFLGRTHPGRIGIIGGEPTLHPEFTDILKRVNEFCDAYNVNSVIFTNGIHLHKYVRLIGERMNCLINVNHPTVVGESNWNSMIKSLNRMVACSNIQRVNLGINLYPDLEDFDYIFDLLKKYKKTTVRVSYVAPTCEYKDVDKDTYYTDAKKLFLPFVERAKSECISVHLDCNHIPLCYFDDDERALLEGVVDGYHDYCSPVIDITPDFQCTACFGAYELISLEKFENIDEVMRYISYKKMYPLVEKNCTGKCKTCSKHENLSCQGGCLAFANK